jgi:GntR family transcriptional regulator
LKFIVDLTSHNPAYAQIMGQVKQAIASGKLSPGDQLPTVRQLAADLRINFNTVARAYRLLDEEGIISTQHGRGTYILERPPAKESERARRRQIVNLVEHVVSESERLGLEPGDLREIVEDQVNAWETENKK